MLVKNYEQFKRIIKFTATIVILSLQTAVYWVVWHQYYNTLIKQPFTQSGNQIILGVYALILLIFLKSHGGNKVGYFKKFDIAYAQILSNIFVNGIAYIQICLLALRFINVIPILIMTGIDMVIIIGWTLVTSAIYKKLYPIPKMISLYGERPANSLIMKMSSRSDKYQIATDINVNKGLEGIKQVIQNLEAVINWDIPSDLRNQILKYLSMLNQYIKSKILLTGNSDIAIYNFRKEIIERLLEENYEVYIVLPYGDKVDELIEMGCHFIDLAIDRRGTNPIKDLFVLINYIKILRRIRPSVALTFTIKPNIYAGIACKTLNIPFIANITGLGTSLENKGILHSVALKLYKIGLHRAACLFFQNKGNQIFFKNQQLAVRNIRLIPGSGVNLAEHSFEEYPANDEVINFIYIGRIMKDKGVGELFDAIPKVTAHYQNVYFNIIGDSEEDYTEQILNLEKQGNTKYHGKQSDVHSFIKDSHVTVLPSYHEGMANALLESASSGRPVLASKVTGCLETFDEGISGLGFESKNVDSLVQTIIKFIEMPYEQKKEMGIAGRKKMEREFNRQNVVNAYIEEIEKVMIKKS